MIGYVSGNTMDTATAIVDSTSAPEELHEGDYIKLTWLDGRSNYGSVLRAGSTEQVVVAYTVGQERKRARLIDLITTGKLESVVRLEKGKSYRKVLTVLGIAADIAIITAILIHNNTSLNSF